MLKKTTKRNGTEVIVLGSKKLNVGWKSSGSSRKTYKRLNIKRKRL